VFVPTDEATILHADVDAFFASVEQRNDPRLRGRAVIVGKGVVMASTYEARACGVHGGMNGARARRLCPQAISVDPDFDSYIEASRELFEIFRRTAPIVEGLSMEEAFIDVRGLEHISGTPAEIATQLRRQVRDELGLPITVGVATSKTIAKMASRAAKPDGMLVIDPGREREFLHPIAVEDMWGIGASTAEKLHRLGLSTVGDLAACPEGSLTVTLGRAVGGHLHALANLRERRPVRSNRSRGSFGSQTALGRRRLTATEVESTLAALVERVTRRMRTAGRCGRTVVLRLRFDDYKRATRSHTLPRATASTSSVLLAARKLLAEAKPMIERRGLTLVGVSVAGLEHPGAGVQLELPIDRAGTDELDGALDELRDRYGADAVSRGTKLSRTVFSERPGRI
jgi:DNA polymerase IV